MNDLDLNNTNQTSLGMEENIESALCYVLGALTGLVFFFVETKNKTVKFHAVQSILLTIVLVIVNILVAILTSIVLFIPYMGWLAALISGVLSLLEFVLWLLVMYKAYQGEKFKLPIIGDIAVKNSL